LRFKSIQGQKLEFIIREMGSPIHPGIRFNNNDCSQESPLIIGNRNGNHKIIRPEQYKSS
jgi:hypothetical protein